MNFFPKQNNLNSSVFITWIFPYAKVTEMFYSPCLKGLCWKGQNNVLVLNLQMIGNGTERI